MEYVFHKLDIKGILQGPPHDWWYKLRWKPIRNGTWNLCLFKERDSKWRRLGIRFSKSCAHNGWGRMWDGFDIRISLYFWDINFWIHYNHACMAGDSFDTGDMKYCLSQEKADKWKAENDIRS